MSLDLVKLQRQMIRIFKKGKSLTGVLIYPNRLHSNTMSLKMLYGLIKVSDLKRQMSKALRFGVTRTLGRTGE
jgi:hypothetical protein